MIPKLISNLNVRPVGYRGVFATSDFNGLVQELVQDLNGISTSWNTFVVPLLDSLPTGNSVVPTSKRTATPNPYVNGLDGSQMYLDATSTRATDRGLFYDTITGRPKTIKESVVDIYDSLVSRINSLSTKVDTFSVSSDSSTGEGLTDAEKDSIGAHIFDNTETSADDSLDGRITILEEAEPVDGSLFLKHDGSVVCTGDLDLGSNQLVDVGAPILPTDGTNKDYVDTAIAGITEADRSKTVDLTAGNIGTGSYLADGGFVLYVDGGAFEPFKVEASAVPAMSVSISGANNPAAVLPIAYAASGAALNGCGLDFGLTISPAPITPQWRIDLVSITEGPVATVTTGAAAIAPIAPTIPTDCLACAYVKVRSDVVSIVAGDICDIRRTPGVRGEYDPFTGDGSTKSFILSHRIADRHFKKVYAHRNGLRMAYKAAPTTIDEYCVLNRVGTVGDTDASDTNGSSVTTGTTLRFGIAPLLNDDVQVDLPY